MSNFELGAAIVQQSLNPLLLSDRAYANHTAFCFAAEFAGWVVFRKYDQQ